MAHEVETAMYSRTPAWHKVGNVLEEPPETIGDALEMSGLDWEVLERDLYWADNDPDSGYAEVNTHKALVRSTDDKLLGVVGVKYQPLQNVEAFEFFNTVLESGQAEIEAAGSLRGGKRIWVLAKLKGATADVVKGDPVEAYLLLYNAHDGSLAVGIMFTNVRVVCANTLRAAMWDAEKGRVSNLKIRHTSGLHDSLDAVQKAINCAKQTFEFSLEAYQELAKKKLPIDGLKDYVREVLDVPDDEEKMPRAWEKIVELHEAGAGTYIKGVRGTYWGAYNAMTEWLAYERGTDECKRLDSGWFGKSGNLNARALEVALQA